VTASRRYVLGADEAEIARLDAQAAVIAHATDVLLRAAGIGAGMHVLDLGTGLGHVAFRVAELVGPDGSVIGIDQAAPLLEVAEERRRASGADNVRFLEADVRAFAPDDPIDAVVGRLILFHLPDAVEILRHHAEALRPGGLVLAIDFDVGSARAEPATPLVTKVCGWVDAAFRQAGAQPTVGARLALLLRDAGLGDVQTFGVQRYLAPDDPAGPAMLAAVAGALAGPIAAAGIADETELGIGTLAQRIADELRAADAVLLPPAVAGAWGRRE
jgi:SAM-dependent methyltransferase